MLTSCCTTGAQGSQCFGKCTSTTRSIASITIPTSTSRARISSATNHFTSLKIKSKGNLLKPRHLTLKHHLPTLNTNIMATGFGYLTQVEDRRMDSITGTIQLTDQGSGRSHRTRTNIKTTLNTASRRGGRHQEWYSRPRGGTVVLSYTSIRSLHHVIPFRHHRSLTSVTCQLAYIPNAVFRFHVRYLIILSLI